MGGNTGERPAFAAYPPVAHADEPQATSLYQQIVDAYLDGKWDEVELGLLAPPEKLAALNAREREDIAYIRLAREECHPPWWNLCKGGQKVQFRPVVWGKTLNVTYVPDGQRGVQAQYHNADVSFTATWPAAEMDSPAPFEHGFTKGELNAVEVWAMLGTARVWSQTSGRMLAGLGEKEKLRMTRREDFRSNLTALYYGSSKLRRWSLLVDLLTWTDKKYADLPVAGSQSRRGDVSRRSAGRSGELSLVAAAEYARIRRGRENTGRALPQPHRPPGLDVGRRPISPRRHQEIRCRQRRQRLSDRESDACQQAHDRRRPRRRPPAPRQARRLAQSPLR